MAVRLSDWLAQCGTATRKRPIQRAGRHPHLPRDLRHRKLIVGHQRLSDFKLGLVHSLGAATETTTGNRGLPPGFTGETFLFDFILSERCQGDRLGRSLPDLVAFLSDIQNRGCDLYLHQQAVDTSTPSGRMLFQMLAVFAEFERAIITSRITAGLDRARAKGVQFGRPNLSLDRRTKVQKALIDGLSIRQVAKATGVSTASVQRIKRSMKTVEEAATAA